jgi:hypothetical protein
VRYQNDAEIQIGEWELWHTYASYFLVEGLDLAAVARSLVESDVAVASCLFPDNRVYGRNQAAVTTADIEIERSGEATEACLKYPLLSDEYACEAVYQCAAMRFAEMLRISPLMVEGIPYLRALCPPMILCDPTHQYILYPQVRLFGNGVLLIHFRMRSPKHPTAISSFVDDYVNLYQFNADVIRMPIAALSLAEHCWASEAGNREARTLAEKQVARAIAHHESSLEQVDLGDFSFQLSAVPSDESVFGSSHHNLGAVRWYLTKAIESCVAKTVKGRLVGRHCSLEGEYWSGRPTVYLFDYALQPSVFGDVPTDLENAFGRILARIGRLPAGRGKEFLGKNHRPAGDHILLTNQGINLVAYSSSGVAAQAEWADGNSGHLVYDRQVQFEAMDYLRMSYRQAEQLSRGKTVPLRNLAVMQESLSVLDSHSLSMSPYGEISDLAVHFGELFRFRDARARIRENITLQIQLRIESRSRRLSVLGLALALIFGLLQSPAFSDYFHVALWEVMVAIIIVIGVAWVAITWRLQ